MIGRRPTETTHHSLDVSEEEWSAGSGLQLERTALAADRTGLSAAGLAMIALRAELPHHLTLAVMIATLALAAAACSTGRRHGRSTAVDADPRTPPRSTLATLAALCLLANIGTATAVCIAVAA